MVPKFPGGHFFSRLSRSREVCGGRLIGTTVALLILQPSDSITAGQLIDTYGPLTIFPKNIQRSANRYGRLIETIEYPYGN